MAATTGFLEDLEDLAEEMEVPLGEDGAWQFGEGKVVVDEEGVENAKR